MKQKIIIIFAFIGLMLGMSSCSMRTVSGTPYKIYNNPQTTKKHYGIKKNSWQRKRLWGDKRYGPRPYRHRGRYRY